MAELDSKTIVLGVSGGIAAYKSVELARLMVRAGAAVKVVMTEAATRFVTPLTFRTVTRNSVATSLWSDPSSPFPHISLSDEADMVVVAPATADIIAKCANGIADDLLSTTLLAASGAVMFAPAMNERMYRHPATQANLRMLRERGALLVDPCAGELACGSEGVGRMAEPAEILQQVMDAVIGSGERDLEGARIVVTAGPTREAIDPVRFISNPSTGLMGFCIASRAASRGANVTLVVGPTHLEPPAVETVTVVTAEEMLDKVLAAIDGADALIMAAAPADFRLENPGAKKIKKAEGVPELKLVPAQDIIKSVNSSGRRPRVVVGFAAETDSVIENAQKKLKDKELDLVVANSVCEPGTGFGSPTDRACIISRAGESPELETTTKTELADRILDAVSGML